MNIYIMPDCASIGTFLSEQVTFVQLLRNELYGIFAKREVEILRKAYNSVKWSV